MSGPLRVTLVAPGFPPERGGVEAHAGHLVRQLTALGVEMRVLTARRGLRRPVTETREGVRITTFPAWRTTVMSVSPRLLLAGLRASRDADLVHVHSYHAACGFAALGGFFAPVVLTPHYHGGGHSTGAVLLHRGYRFVGRLLFRAARAVICVSRAERDLVLRDFPAAATRTWVVPNGVNLAAIRAAEPFPGQPRTILSLGRLEPYKRVAVLLHALPDLPSDAQLVVVGDGSQLDELRKLTRELGIADRVRFTGPISTAEVHRWLRTARVLVSLSEHEAFGMAPVEAAAAGAGVVLSDIPAHREIAADHLGALADLIDPEPRAVAAAVTARLDDAERTEANVPDWARIAEETLAVYRAVHRTDRKDTSS
ncbi:glycosyltransferase family 4 protein [Amycolatopsis sp. H20-H5]|uniref:glycosyltransferase family 4 protein n=1 Tax=Amycolatopsis sp. H20-H5 TaxID=3046309 RepID=UPI002DBD783B|nr:glycosyltransferase family 4 protein [Amycolatopsis sp. H20-H5]MEC3980061.1 glycosyltransferase family 4 protein [Amycolatopsis sp. H20-H5]